MNFKAYYLNEDKNKLGFLKLINKNPNFDLQPYLNDVNKAIKLLHNFYKPIHDINVYFYDFDKSFDELQTKYGYSFTDPANTGENELGFANENNVLINTQNINTDFLITLIHEIGHVLYSEIRPETRTKIYNWYNENVKNKMKSFKREKLNDKDVDILWNEYLTQQDKPYKEKIKELKNDIFSLIKQKDDTFQKDSLYKIERYLINNFKNFDNVDEKTFKNVLSKMNISSERITPHGDKAQELEKSGQIPTLYSATNPEEMFSELLAYLLISPEKLNDISKKFMENIINVLKKENV